MISIVWRRNYKSCFLKCLDMPPIHVPSATYRIQLNQDFRFADAIKILDYLHELGISDLYLSPILASRKGSIHGYDQRSLADRP